MATRRGPHSKDAIAALQLGQRGISNGLLGVLCALCLNHLALDACRRESCLTGSLGCNKYACSSLDTRHQDDPAKWPAAGRDERKMVGQACKTAVQFPESILTLVPSTASGQVPEDHHPGKSQRMLVLGASLLAVLGNKLDQVHCGRL